MSDFGGRGDTICGIGGGIGLTTYLVGSIILALDFTFLGKGVVNERAIEVL